MLISKDLEGIYGIMIVGQKMNFVKYADDVNITKVNKRELLDNNYRNNRFFKVTN